VSKQFEIDEAARQLSRDKAQVVLTESAKELEKETATTPGEFPLTPKNKGELAPPPDPDSSSSDSDSDSNNNMSEAGPADPPAPPPDPVLQRTTRFAAKQHQPLTSSGEGDDLKEEAFETWYTLDQLYLNLTGVTPNAPGSGTYWILYTTKRALKASDQAFREFGDDITRDQLVGLLRDLFVSTRQKDNLFEKFNTVQQVTKEGKVRRITEVIVDLKMYQNQLSEEVITDDIFGQRLYNSMHSKLRQQAELIYDEDDTCKQLIKDVERINAVLRNTGVYKSEKWDYSSSNSKPKNRHKSKGKSAKEYNKQDRDDRKAGKPVTPAAERAICPKNVLLRSMTRKATERRSRRKQD